MEGEKRRGGREGEGRGGERMWRGHDLELPLTPLSRTLLIEVEHFRKTVQVKAR